MNIIVFGLSISSAYGNGHATLWRGLCRELAALGHRVDFFERDVPYYAAHRDLTEIPRGALHLYSEWEAIAPTARARLADADAAIVTSYCPDALPAGKLLLEAKRPLRVFYDLDTPVTLDRLRRGEPVFYIGPRGLRDFDLALSFTGGRALDALRDDLGAPRVAPLYGSVDPMVHRPVPSSDGMRADLSYLGTYAADRQEALERLFVEPARRLPERRFLIGGSQYPSDFPWTTNIHFVLHVEPPRHPTFFCSSTLTLNVTRAAMAAMGWCPSGRLFEAAACGAPILSDRWAGLDRFFTPGEEILVAESTDDAVRALSLERDALRAIARRARERVLDEHTARRRASELLALLESASTPAASASAPSSASEAA